jgi:hypothetical protein
METCLEATMSADHIQSIIVIITNRGVLNVMHNRIARHHLQRLIPLQRLLMILENWFLFAWLLL